jgi:rhodanese-related sulfurtransferase
MKRLSLIILALFSTIILAACGQITPTQPTAQPVGKRIEAAGGSYTLLTVSELNTMLANKDFTLVNVHIPYEGEIDQTDEFIAYNEIEKNLAALPNKDARIVLYCRSGGMSETAALALTKLGYTNVMDVEGGMSAWEAAGYPLLRKTN